MQLVAYHFSNHAGSIAAQGRLVTACAEDGVGCQQVSWCKNAYDLAPGGPATSLPVLKMV